MPRRNNNEFITKTVEYIGANLTADLSLEALSKSVGFSPVYFHKLFKASTGKTLRDYVEEQRLKRSVDLLLSTDLTLTQIAYACGFSSQSYFSYAFKKKMKRSLTLRKSIKTKTKQSKALLVNFLSKVTKRGRLWLKEQFGFWY